MRDMINEILLDERYDLPIMESLMYETFSGVIKDSGKRGDARIYQELKALEKEKKVKL
jgi:hypothetical protein